MIEAMKKFIGGRKVKLAYSDNAPEFENAVRTMGVSLDTSTPGRPQNNSLAERTNQFILGTTSTCLLAAGLPACYWPHAVS